MNPALKPGMSLATQRVFDRTDITALTELTGAPDSGEAVPEALINGMFSYLLGVDLPGQGTTTSSRRPTSCGPPAWVTHSRRGWKSPGFVRTSISSI